MKKVALLLIAMLVMAPAAWAAYIPADIVFMIDESGSMSDDQAKVKANIGIFAQTLTDGGINAQFGLVGYGRSANSGQPHVISNLTNLTGFTAAMGSLVASGGTEPGYDATIFSLDPNNITYRTNSVKNLILITDEGSNGDTHTSAQADAALTASSALWNGIINTSWATAYPTLATNHGGAIWDIVTFRNYNATELDAFFVDFSNTKLSEIVTQAEAQGITGAGVPEPTSMILMGIGLAGAALRMRRKS